VDILFLSVQKQIRFGAETTPPKSTPTHINTPSQRCVVATDNNGRLKRVKHMHNGRVRAHLL